MKDAKKTVNNLVRLFHEKLPKAIIEVDAPAKDAGSWFVDVRLGSRAAVVEYRPGLGFGLSSAPSAGYGEGPDEFFEDDGEAVERVAQLLKTGRRTKPQRAQLLRELRQQRGVSQVKLAALLGVKQPTISKLEHRDDVNIGTLRRVVRAMGGTLEVTARFPDGPVEIGVSKHPSG